MPSTPHPVLMLIPTQRTEVKELEQGPSVVCRQEGRQDKPLPTRDMEEREKNRPCSFDCSSQPVLLVTLALLGWDVLLVLLSLGFGSSPYLVLRSLLPHLREQDAGTRLSGQAKGCKDVFL